MTFALLKYKFIHNYGWIWSKRNIRQAFKWQFHSILVFKIPPKKTFFLLLKFRKLTFLCIALKQFFWAISWPCIDRCDPSFFLKAELPIQHLWGCMSLYLWAYDIEKSSYNIIFRIAVPIDKNFWAYNPSFIFMRLYVPIFVSLWYRKIKHSVSLY